MTSPTLGIIHELNRIFRSEQYDLSRGFEEQTRRELSRVTMALSLLNYFYLDIPVRYRLQVVLR
jgi:hypothetical protein